MLQQIIPCHKNHRRLATQLSGDHFRKKLHLTPFLSQKRPLPSIFHQRQTIPGLSLPAHPDRLRGQPQLPQIIHNRPPAHRRQSPTQYGERGPNFSASQPHSPHNRRPAGTNPRSTHPRPFRKFLQHKIIIHHNTAQQKHILTHSQSLHPSSPHPGACSSASSSTYLCKNRPKPAVSPPHSASKPAEVMEQQQNRQPDSEPQDGQRQNHKGLARDAGTGFVSQPFISTKTHVQPPISHMHVKNEATSLVFSYLRPQSRGIMNEIITILLSFKSPSRYKIAIFTNIDLVKKIET